MRRRIAPIALALLAMAMMTLASPSTARAHDANFARWDIRASDERLTVRLSTSQAAIHHSLTSAYPEEKLSGSSPDVYGRWLEVFLSANVLVREGGEALPLIDTKIVYGHASDVTMTFARTRPGALRALSVDLSGFSERPDQHHLVYVHQGDERSRFMLNARAGAVLDWPPSRTQTLGERARERSGLGALPHPAATVATAIIFAAVLSLTPHTQ